MEGGEEGGEEKRGEPGERECQERKETGNKKDLRQNCREEEEGEVIWATRN